ncbi:hypothetical protein B9G54_01520 [Alloscardovia macacae]|uniref:Uncharacterized protein n=1 Tax=Alloscardovia macacae TaxID=1160091 RepID=A0A1Y2SVX5_9BIFI|nr:hypothetical protein [Alloscardovia macacae]OTA27225.1 hypothetical protein B9G54_01520 [Alloscardovia macacae]OTA29235.1 hypothetical protein B9T39_03715 [Alloscardovia macacae]
MQTVVYECAVTGETVSFDGPLYGETLASLRGYKWAYSLGAHSVSGVGLQAREVTANFKVTSRFELDRARKLFTADMREGKPGTLVIDSRWRQKAFITAHEPSDITPELMTSQLTIVLLDGVWWREGATVECAVHSAEGGTWLDLPSDLPFDLQAPRMSAHVENIMPSSMPFRLRIYGPSNNPRVRIGGNDYMLDVLIPSGGYVTVDSRSRAATLVAANGDTSNVLSSAHRGSGLGGGAYIFEPLAPGVSQVEWDGSFGFDVTPIVEEVEPAWSM